MGNTSEHKPPPPEDNNEPIPSTEGQPMRKEPLTTNTEEDNAVAKKKMVRTKEPSIEQGNNNHNIAFQTNAPPPRYQSNVPPLMYPSNAPPPGYQSNDPQPGYQSNVPPLMYPSNAPTPGYKSNAPKLMYPYNAPPPMYRSKDQPPMYRPDVPPHMHQSYAPSHRYTVPPPNNDPTFGTMPRPTRPPTYRGNSSRYGPGYQANTLHSAPNRRGTRRPPSSSGSHRGQGTRGAFRGTDICTNNLKHTATNDIENPDKKGPRSRDGVNDQAKKNVDTNQKRNRNFKSSRNDDASKKMEEFEIENDGTASTTNDSNDSSCARKKTGKQSKRRHKNVSDESGNGTDAANVEETNSALDYNRKTSDPDDLSQGPNVQAVFDYMVKEMNGKGSPVEITRKSGLFSVSFDEDMIENWFKSKSRMFKSIVRNGHVDCVLVYLRQINYCLDYISKRSCKNSKCARYHVCKDMLCGNCMYGDGCNKSHDFFDSTLENLSISKGLSFTAKYTNEQVLSIMQCRYPHICHDWNQEKGCGLVKCEKLHICKAFMLGKCQTGDDCDYGHDRMSVHNKPIIEAYEMTSWKDEFLRRIIFIKREVVPKERVEPSVVEVSANQPERTDIDKHKTESEIELCERYLLDNCKDSKCRLYHNEDLRLPYVWQIKLWNKWVNVSQSEAVEKEYCAFQDKSEPFYVNDMESDRSELVEIAFQPAISARVPDSDTKLEARRLSTRSYVFKGPMNFRTQWRWYYKVDTGEEHMYCPGELQHSLEMKYLSGQTDYTFMKEGFPHINFASMSLCADGTSADGAILRRPLIVTRDDVDERRVPPSPDSAVEIKVPLPRGWAQWDNANTAELINLVKTSDEYAKVDEKFFERLERSRLRIQGVFRIQNSEQWAQFVSKEASMLNAVKRAQKARDKVDKRYLFHGTDNFAAVKGISRNNLDPRVSGKNATNFGQGTYFAAEARLAHQYTMAPDRYVFMVNVLVGEFTKGQSAYRKPPEKPDTDGEFYDSCVDDENHPMKFVVFDSNQYYPEYLIWYRDTDGDDF